MPVNSANRDFLSSGKTLEFEVFHTSAPQGDDGKGASHLIGVAFVPLKPLVEGAGKTRFTGLYDVVPKDKVYQSVQSLGSTKLEGKGKIKVTINCSANVRKLMQGETLPVVATPAKQPVEEQPEEPQTEDIGTSEFSKHMASLTADQLGAMHTMNMDDLEALQSKIKESLSVLGGGNKAEDRAPSFGQTTFKTDVQRSQLTTEIEEFRRSALENPFVSQETLGKPATVPEEEEDDITRHEEVKNPNEETVFDLAEMQRIEKILKQNK